MSGIFKGDSIYKSGGGGGGFKDGGQLVDGDFIHVENNTISSYDNVSRDPVNFYFEVKDGEVLNSVVELTTAVNATINVYVVKNGFYYLLGNVGGNTVNAGDDYKVNITGDSYAIEQVSAPPSIDYAEINGVVYGVKKFGNQLYMTEDYKGSFGTFYNAVIPDQNLPPASWGYTKIYDSGWNDKGIMYRIKPYNSVNTSEGTTDHISQFLESVRPFRLPKGTDSIFSNTSSYVKTNLNLTTYGYGQIVSNGVNLKYNGLIQNGKFAMALDYNDGLGVVYEAGSSFVFTAVGDCFLRIRLCMDV